MTKEFDVLILGGGPIGASTAYALSKNAGIRIGLLTAESGDTTHATYQNAGGSIRTYWDDPLKVEMTETTANAIYALDEQGVDLSLHKDTYLFMHRGVSVPSLNINSAKLVKHFLSSATQKGVEVIYDSTVQSIEHTPTGAAVRTSTSEYSAKKVLFALGAQNQYFMPDLELEKEERYLMSLDITITPELRAIPHIIIPLEGGVVYLFIKKVGEEYKLIVGQEDVLEVPEEKDIQEHFEKLLSLGLGDIMPFLKGARVEKSLWGMDVGNKTLLLESKDNVLFSANCGSAIRSCVWIGNKVAEELSK